MKDNLFSILGVYKPGENRTPEENFTTEILVYLLKYSQSRSKELLTNFMKLLGLAIDVDEIKISTQKSFKTKRNCIARPDITIYLKDRIVFVEVKLESDLNYYNNINEEETPWNQIEQYQDIICIQDKEIYLLTKHRHANLFESCKDYKRNILWQDIHDILSKHQSNDAVEVYLISEFLRYMEDKRMIVPKVEKDLLKGIDALLDLASQLLFAIENNTILKYTKPNSSWMGYYLKDKENRDMGYVGLNFGETRLTYIYSNNHREYFVFDEHDYFSLSSEEQLKKLSGWIKYNYSLNQGVLEVGNQPDS